MEPENQDGRFAIPEEYRKITEDLFPPDVSAGPGINAAAGFAEALGISGEYQRLLEVKKNSDEMRQFLVHFQNNLDLLIQKTWVEKSDESRKEKLLDDILPFMALIIQGDFKKGLEAFGVILDEVSYLLFGHDSTQDDFTEYTFRIDIQMGLFWWYGSKLGSLKAANDEILWAVLLIGICYLTNF
jgi:hypothetical protein